MELGLRGGQPFWLTLTHPKAYIHIPAAMKNITKYNHLI